MQYFRIYKNANGERSYLADYFGEAHTERPERAHVFSSNDVAWWDEFDWLFVEPLPEDEQMRLNGAPMLFP